MADETGLRVDNQVKGPERKSIIDPVDVFLDRLISTGMCEIKTPKELGDRKFVLAYRHAKNPTLSTPAIDHPTFYQRLRFSAGFTDVHAIDLFEEVVYGEEKVFVPIGHRDYTLARFSDTDETRAAGNFATKRQYLAKTGGLPNNSLFNPYELADESWGGAVANAIDVLGSYNDRESHGDVSKLRGILTVLGFPTNETWKGHDFGKLLTALGLKFLKHEEVTKLEIGSQNEQELVPIFVRLVKTPIQDVIPGSDINEQACNGFIRPFLK